MDFTAKSGFSGSQITWLCPKLGREVVGWENLCITRDEGGGYGESTRG